jgi:hypothetical protein
MDWLEVWTKLPNPGHGKSDEAEVHQPMDWLGFCPNLTYRSAGGTHFV